ncbi:MAG: thioredoxin family protein [Carboxylicivirga sp.]|jgi:arsenate reductase-like glutaredoxin family protein|nr:thioredoxin family protein [Carboxylicivirga sp.]
MKAPLKKLKAGIACLCLIAAIASCNSSNKKEKTCCSEAETKTSQTCCSSKANPIDADKVSVVYFHATRRCATCQAVEKVTKETLAKHHKEVPFHSINREEEKELAQKYKVEWQTLMVMKGDKMVNLTNEAFMNARTKPEKLEALLKSTIESML